MPSSRSTGSRSGAGALATPERVRLHSLSDVQMQLAEREAAKERLIPFCRYVWKNFETTDYREVMAAALELVESRAIRRLLLMAPPQIGKSRLVSRLYPAWYLGRNPDHQQIICSYNAELATRHSGEARRYFTDPNFKALYGELSDEATPIEISDKKSGAKRWQLKYHEGSTMAAGILGGITGNTAHQLILDDIVRDARDMTSELIRERQKEWYLSAADSRLTPDGVVIVTMTRWHEDDLIGWLLREQENGGDKWYVLRLTAVAETRTQIAQWCQDNYVPPERYLVADSPSDED